MLAECGSVQLFKSSVTKDSFNRYSCRSHHIRGCCRQFLKKSPHCSVVYAVHIWWGHQPSTTMRRNRAVTDINSVALLNFVRKYQCLANTVGQILASMCSLSGRTQKLRIPHVYPWESSENFVLLMESDTPSNFKLVQMHMVLTWFVFS